MTRGLLKRLRARSACARLIAMCSLVHHQQKTPTMWSISFLLLRVWFVFVGPRGARTMIATTCDTKHMCVFCAFCTNARERVFECVRPCRRVARSGLENGALYKQIWLECRIHRRRAHAECVRRVSEIFARTLSGLYTYEFLEDL